MKIQFVRIADRGTANQECIHISVLQEVSLSFYLVMLSRYIQPNLIASSALAAFWFPAQSVKAGDQILLFTGVGQASTRPGPNGNTTYLYYWGWKTTIFQDPAACVVLLEGASWITSPQGG